jgi:hypothetical protein
VTLKSILSDADGALQDLIDLLDTIEADEPLEDDGETGGRAATGVAQAGSRASADVARGERSFGRLRRQA